MSTPRDDRAAAREQRIHLQIVANRLERIRSRSPSPARQYPPLPPSPKRSSAEVEEDQFRDALSQPQDMAAGGDQATIRALAEALQGMKVSSRKPDLPSFDPANIELWIKRVDNAYRRAGVTDPRDKFAHIESKFAVDSDARIQSFIFGEGTEAEWASFTSYLKERYGKSKSQRASILLDGVKREGRMPSEMFAFVKEKIGDLTIDDLIKEMVVRELPVDIQRTIHEQAKSLDGAATTKLADAYFDKDGKPIHKSSSAPVNNVEVETDNEEDDVNAVNRGKPRSRPFPPGRNQNSRTPWSQGTQQPPRQGPQQRPQHVLSQNNRNRAAPAPGEKRENRGAPTVKDVKLCKFHLLYGDSARTCEPTCAMFPKWSGNGRAGRQT